MPANILATWEALKAQAAKSDLEALDRIIDAYIAGYDRLDPLVLSLTEQMDALLKVGKLTPNAIKSSAVYRNLIRTVTSELDDYAAYLRTEISVQVKASAKAGIVAGETMLLAGIAASLGVEVNDLPKDVITRLDDRSLAYLAKYLDKDGALFKKVNELSGYHANEIAEGILDRVGRGLNPRDIGEWITDAYGMGLTDSIRTMRTVQLYSYREANAETQRENADVLQGGVWVAELDDRVCMSCIALHGTEFPAGTVCDDHHNGRCAIIPWVKGEPNPIEQSGADWFKAQDEGTQKSMMGAAKWNAWNEGKFEFSQLSREYNDDIFGVMRGETPLKDLIGE